jgi:hypothetical protein
MNKTQILLNIGYALGKLCYVSDLLDQDSKLCKKINGVISDLENIGDEIIDGDKC